MPKIAYQKIVKESIQSAALEYLLKLKNNPSKVAHIPYLSLKMQDYFKPDTFSADLAKFTFLCRSRMLLVGENFKHGQQDITICPLCNITTELDSQQHLLLCVKLNANNIVDENPPKYEDLFCQSSKKMRKVTEFLKVNFKKRTKLLNQNQS